MSKRSRDSGPRIVGTYKPLGWQVAPWRDTSLLMLLTGSAGGGKSRLAAEKVHAYCLKYPGAMALVARKTRESMVNSTVLVLAKRIIAGDPSVRHNQSKSRFEYANGSILAYGGMKDDQQRQQIRSIGQDGGLDICWLEEANAFTEEDFNEILARMRGKAAPWRQVILSTNPDAPTHWIYKRLIEGGEASVHRSAATDNTHNAHEYLDTLNRMTGVQKARLADGQWVQAEGAIYPEFDPTLHVIEPFPIPAGWRKVRSVDFGYRNPFVCLWAAQDPDGRIYVYRELYRSGRIVEQHVTGEKDADGGLVAPGIIQHSEDETCEATVADHDAEDRATMERHGVYTVAAFKDVKPGIEAVVTRLRVDDDGKPRLMIFRDVLVELDQSLAKARKPTHTAEEFPGYIWAKSKDGTADKEEPIKLNDHGLDALRYAVAYLDDIGSEQYQFIAGSAAVLP